MAIDGYIIYTFNNKELIDLGELNTLEIYGQKLISTSNIYIYEYGSDEDKIMLLEPNQTFVKGLDEKMDYFCTQNGRVALTEHGFEVSNALLAEILNFDF